MLERRLIHNGGVNTFPLTSVYNVVLLDMLKYWKPNELLNILDEARKVSTRNHLIILLSFKHGLRASEVARLRLKDVANGRLDCARLKGSLHTNRPLESNDNILLDEKRALTAYIADRPSDSSPFLFLSRLSVKARERCAERRTDTDRWGEGLDHTARGISRDAIAEVVEDACFHAGIEPGRRHHHCGKHTLGRLSYEAGLGLLDIQQLLGHRDIKATSMYTSVTQDEAHAKAKTAFATIFA